MAARKTKLALASLLALVLALGCFVGCDREPAEEVERGEISMEFEYLMESAFDAAPFKNLLSVDENVPLTFYESFNNQDELADLATKRGFDYPKDFDFENYRLLVSYGRKVVQLEASNNTHYGPYFYYLIPTFAGTHSGDTVFFYRIDKRSYLGNLHLECYIMLDAERVYFGSSISSENWDSFNDPAFYASLETQPEDQ
ncbi:MAG: hypothetical protein FWE41_04580 [Coriobacteriia bacterium]|nr:hypothetical protein [Coriobacteriia bacterium]MCL2750766.1 hypothetical protein [Coriobacteriia bacterium]